MPRTHRRNTPLRLGRVAALALGLPLIVDASPHLHCQLDYGGQTQVLDIRPQTDPYAARPVSIGDHFRFKAVAIGDDSRVDYVKIHVHYLTPRQPMLLQHATYLAPAPTAATDDRTLTGDQRLYSPDLGRELDYRCALRETAP